MCNHFDPRDHTNSVYENEDAKEPRASLSLVVDALSLAKVTESGCRFCLVLALALDAFFGGWRGARVRVNVDIKEKGTIKVTLGGERWKDEIAEIYAGPGRLFSLHGECIVFFKQHIECIVSLSVRAKQTAVMYATLVYLTAYSITASMAYLGFRASHPNQLRIG